MKKVILIEDDEAIRHVFSLALSPLGFEIIGYDSGEKIISKQMEVPDLFVLDKNISGVEGTELCRQVKSDPAYKAVPVLLLSASPDIARAASECGADGFIMKPFTVKNLRSEIAKYCS